MKTAQEFSPEEYDRMNAMSWKQQVKRLQTEALVFYFAFKHPRVRWYARIVAACVAGYLFSPIQLIPSFIPVVGFLDDLLVFFLGVKLLQRIIPPDVLIECRELTAAVETRRKEEARSRSAVVAIVVIVSLWLLAAVAANVLVGRGTWKYWHADITHRSATIDASGELIKGTKAEMHIDDGVAETK